MKYHSTITQAFKAGTGDAFYQKGGKYIAIHRTADAPKDAHLMTYEQVRTKGAQERQEQAIKTAIQAMSESIQLRKERKIVRSYSNTSNGRDGYFDEYPDAYNQAL